MCHDAQGGGGPGGGEQPRAPGAARRIAGSRARAPTGGRSPASRCPPGSAPSRPGRSPRRSPSRRSRTIPGPRTGATPAGPGSADGDAGDDRALLRGVRPLRRRHDGRVLRARRPLQRSGLRRAARRGARRDVADAHRPGARPARGARRPRRGRGGAHRARRLDRHYTFTQTGRPVVNHVRATFRFDADGLFAEHDDAFSFHAWARQALGTQGLLLGWTPVLRSAVRRRARGNLERFMAS